MSSESLCRCSRTVPGAGGVEPSSLNGTLAGCVFSVLTAKLPFPKKFGGFTPAPDDLVLTSKSADKDEPPSSRCLGDSYGEETPLQAAFVSGCVGFEPTTQGLTVLCSTAGANNPKKRERRGGHNAGSGMAKDGEIPPFPNDSHYRIRLKTAFSEKRSGRPGDSNRALQRQLLLVPQGVLGGGPAYVQKRPLRLLVQGVIPLLFPLPVVGHDFGVLAPILDAE